MQPLDMLRLDTSYGGYWLASDTDVWANTSLRDKSGDSGRFMGQEADVRTRMQINKKTDLTLGYSHFFSGGFTTSQGRANNTDFFYCETTLRFL